MEDFGPFFRPALGDLAHSAGGVELVAVGQPCLGLTGDHVVGVETGRKGAASRVFAGQARDAPEAVVFDPDNGPELTAAVLREWCRLGKTGTAYIEPGSPWQNPYVESFNARMREELLNTEAFTCLEEAQVLAADWREDYNANHPHSALA